ncbi:MAG: helix-hairpin-helix domain-containing protein, partial [Patescibacteria group bacterium]
GDVGLLTSVPGVGKKTAQKLILELKGVLVMDEPIEDTETLDALMSIGYARKDCQEVLRYIEGETPEDRIMSALKLLGRSDG